MSDAKVLFTVPEDEKLVEIVAKFPCVYNLASTEYKKPNVKENAWKEIAEFVERSPEDCKKRWRNIKDTYQKRQKKRARNKSYASNKGKKWPLADMLTFLDQVDHKRSRSISNVWWDDTSAQENDPLMYEYIVKEEADETSATQNTHGLSTQDAGIQPTTKRRKKHTENDTQLLEAGPTERPDIINRFDQDRDDDVDLFFKSIAMSVKKLRPNLINEAKMRSLQMVIDLQSRNEQHLNLPSRSAPCTYSTSSSPSSGN